MMERERGTQGAQTVDEQLTAAATDVSLMASGKKNWARDYERWYKQRHGQTEPPAITSKSFQTSEVTMGYNFGPDQAIHLLEAVKSVAEKAGRGFAMEVASARAAKRITAYTRPTDLFDGAHPFTNGVKVTVRVEGIEDRDERAKATWIIANVLGDSRIDKALGGPASDVRRRSPELGEMLGKLA